MKASLNQEWNEFKAIEIPEFYIVDVHGDDEGYRGNPGDWILCNKRTLMIVSEYEFNLKYECKSEKIELEEFIVPNGYKVDIRFGTIYPGCKISVEDELFYVDRD